MDNRIRIPGIQYDEGNKDGVQKRWVGVCVVVVLVEQD